MPTTHRKGFSFPQAFDGVSEFIKHSTGSFIYFCSEAWMGSISGSLPYHSKNNNGHLNWCSKPWAEDSLPDGPHSHSGCPRPTPTPLGALLEDFLPKPSHMCIIYFIAAISNAKLILEDKYPNTGQKKRVSLQAKSFHDWNISLMDPSRCTQGFPPPPPTNHQIHTHCKIYFEVKTFSFLVCCYWNVTRHCLIMSTHGGWKLDITKCPFPWGLAELTHSLGDAGDAGRRMATFTSGRAPVVIKPWAQPCCKTIAATDH